MCHDILQMAMDYVFGADSASKCNRLDNFHMYLPTKM